MAKGMYGCSTKNSLHQVRFVQRAEVSVYPKNRKSVTLFSCPRLILSSRDLREESDLWLLPGGVRLDHPNALARAQLIRPLNLGGSHSISHG